MENTHQATRNIDQNHQRVWQFLFPFAATSTRNSKAVSIFLSDVSFLDSYHLEWPAITTDNNRQVNCYILTYNPIFSLQVWSHTLQLIKFQEARSARKHNLFFSELKTYRWCVFAIVLIRHVSIISIIGNSSFYRWTRKKINSKVCLNILLISHHLEWWVIGTDKGNRLVANTSCIQSYIYIC